MADLGNSTRSDRNKPAKHSLRYAYVPIVSKEKSASRQLDVEHGYCGSTIREAVIRQLGSAMKMQRSHLLSYEDHK